MNMSSIFKYFWEFYPCQMMKKKLKIWNKKKIYVYWDIVLYNTKYLRIKSEEICIPNIIDNNKLFRFR